VKQNNKQDPYQCNECKKMFVVMKLARCCELKHQGIVFIRDPRQEPRPKN